MNKETPSEGAEESDYTTRKQRKRRLHVGQMWLGELAQRVGCDYTTVGKAVSRFGQRLRRDKKLAKTMGKRKE